MKPATSITKVCRILSEFRLRPSMGITEIASRTTLLPSDVHRILTSLRATGFVEQDPRTRTYRLGPSLMNLGLAAFQRNQVRDAARPLLLRLSAAVEATAHLALFDARESEILLADQFESTGEGPFRSNVGATALGHNTALGKAIVATLNPQLAVLCLERRGTPRTAPNTITRIDDLEAEFARIRFRGYSLDLEESTAGACCVGASIPDAAGVPVAAISVSMPAARFHRNPPAAYAAAVVATAQELSRQLSGVRT